MSGLGHKVKSQQQACLSHRVSSWRRACGGGHLVEKESAPTLIGRFFLAFRSRTLLNRRVQDRLSIGMIASHDMRAIENAESGVELLQNQDTAAGQGRAPEHGLNLKDHVGQADRVVVINGAFMLNGEDAIQIQRAGRNKSGTGLSGWLTELDTELLNIEVAQKGIGRIQSRDAADAQFLR